MTVPMDDSIEEDQDNQTESNDNESRKSDMSLSWLIIYYINNYLIRLINFITTL